MPSHRSLFRPPFRSPLATALAAVALAILGLGGVPARAADPAALPLAAGSGLRAGDAAWPRWQGRVSLTSMSRDLHSAGRHDAGFGGSGRPLHSLSLFGDYYFTQQGLSPRSEYSGGFRASGGVILGARAASWSLLPGSVAGLGHGFSAERRSFSLSAPPAALDGADAATVPYLGVGYSGLQSIRGTGGGWGFSADVGVMALQPRSAVRLGQQGLGHAVSDLEFSPLLQLGVSYSF